MLFAEPGQRIEDGGRQRFVVEVKRSLPEANGALNALGERHGDPLEVGERGHWRRSEANRVPVLDEQACRQHGL